jgi:D-alanine-D-alanine ligase
MSQRIGVLMGGMSSERAISLKSGHAVAEALRSRGHDVVELDVGPNLPEKLRAHRIDVAWIALHGAFGEDGCVQGLLEVMRIPYTGSGVQASAAAMDKIMTKRLLVGSGVQLPGDHVWRPGQPVPDVALPVVVKTPEGGSTIGIYMCDTQAALEEALRACQQWGEAVLIEQKITGEEITVAVLSGRALPVVSIRPREGFFDFEATPRARRTTWCPLPCRTTSPKMPRNRRSLPTRPWAFAASHGRILLSMQRGFHGFWRSTPFRE